MSVCPQHAITRKGLEDEAYEYAVDEDLCIGCGFCAGACLLYGHAGGVLGLLGSWVAVRRYLSQFRLEEMPRRR